ncbi:hypothetical protein MHU86_1889 [Fragilaria crotonensis]|nr:hypothetical protein MHU86_1889 [Fragilaria crotonensis]
MSITVSDVHVDSLHGPEDEYIMNADHLKRCSRTQQTDLNLVRLWLQATTLANLADPDRPNRILLDNLGAKRSASFVPSDTWPRQSQPTKAQIRLWKRFITSSYLRYIPYWKTTQSRRQALGLFCPIRYMASSITTDKSANSSLETLYYVVISPLHPLLDDNTSIKTVNGSGRATTNKSNDKFSGIYLPPSPTHRAEIT